jgi:hypothetical protein
MSRRLIHLLIVILLLPVAAASASAQALPPDTLTPVAEPIPREAPLPRAAFIRALVLPGWGHFAIGEYRRGAVYATLQGASWAMLFTTVNRVGSARDEERVLNVRGVDSLTAAMAADTALARRLGADPQAYESALLTYPGLRDARNLVMSRERHQQDWIVYTLVFTFASAIDAYVTAHLADFPVEVTATRGPGGSSSLRFSVPVGGRR